MSEGALSDYTVLVTRPEHQSHELAGLIREAGGKPLVAPMIGIRAVDDSAGTATIIKQLDAYDIAVFTSRNAVDFSFGLLSVGDLKLDNLEIYAVGLGTALQLKGLGVENVQTPRAVFNSEGLLELAALSPARVNGKRDVIFRGRGGRGVLAEVLQARGAEVEYCEAYERFVPDTSLTEVLEGNGGDLPDVAIVTSLAGLTNLADKIADDKLEQFFDVPLLVISARIAEEVVRLGFTNEPLVVETPGDSRIVKALIEWAGGEL